MTLHFLYIILFSHCVLRISCIEWPTWRPKTKVTKSEKGPNYINPWLFEIEEKEQVTEAILPQSNFDQNQPQQEINNFGLPGQITNPAPASNNFQQSAPQWSQGPQQGFLPNQPLSRNNFGVPNHNFYAPPQPQAQVQPPQPTNPPTQVKDFFMEPVNNKKPASKGINPWLTGSYEVPEWIKNPPPKVVNEPPRKTKWDMEDEDNRKKAQVMQKFGHVAPPAYAHNFNNNYKAMMDKKALDSRGNLMYATQKEITSARRGSGYQTREEMIKEGSFQEVPKNYYEGKIVPMEETKAIISYTNKKLNKLKSPNKRTNKDPPKGITGKNWLDNLIGSADTTKSCLLSIVTELTFLLIASFVL